MKSNPEIDKILNKSKAGQRLSVSEGVRLFQSTGPELHKIIATADEHRQKVVGEKISYVVNRNLNLSNICINSCQFCGFKRNPDSPEAYLLSIDEVQNIVQQAVQKQQISELCLVSGLHPDFDLDYYLQVIKAIKSVAPQLHVHGITPEELKHALRQTELSFAEGYAQLKRAGLDSVAGTAAEILVPRVRKKICPEKITTKEWITAIKAAHQLGLKSTATIMYGHVESTKERIEHLQIIRNIQEETQGFTEFIPLAFIHQQTPLYQQGVINKGSTAREDILMIAIARLFLDNIDNIQTSWVKYGPKLAQFTLQAGANDLGGTLYSEKISKEAGAKNGEYLTPAQLKELIEDLNRVPQQRATTY
ncbi:7,8-didemethyl-8-hydroxy-5-deazariboflavin synthase subunit CofH [Fuchsiella alkaliacetigena]|uniref:7,8-didemethyl-8-hydroxy-5-deazariboflavin synthase subunit CofH n=1 Tax=Fuchsiella alkaliacetigena TaxID=957042 RepID=UPI00200A8D72|nr:7,8-didemethyl-8-hydroxy-5-deazariboflavin synthase subunit CofH [Fuchsiella alkaliacetigena]MCK8824648.1 7,8-didemethyl-8-hydroxy-5-deazariboflavin synthase subunit CofH [Fuchsiella alkaliacetigena]